VILLDTNVISEPTRPSPSEAVLRWLDVQPRAETFVTVISEAEMLGGAMALNAGRRRDILAQQIDLIFAQEFAGRVLSFDSAAARVFSAVARRVRGKFIFEPDAQIAAIALAHGAAIATRNTRHFIGRGVRLVNPWTGEEK
jgi:predicted nucleic acid-binding protein